MAGRGQAWVGGGRAAERRERIRPEQDDKTAPAGSLGPAGGRQLAAGSPGRDYKLTHPALGKWTVNCGALVQTVNGSPVRLL